MRKIRGNIVATTMSVDKIAERMGGASASFINEATGSAIALKDSTDAKLQGLTLYGNSESNVDSITVKVMGKNLWRLENFVDTTNYASMHVELYELPKGVPLTLSADITKYPDDTATNTRMYFGCYYADGTRDSAYSVFDENNAERDGVARRKSATFTINPNKQVTKISCSLNDYSSQNGRNAKAENIQIEVGATATEYEPYKEPQTLTVPTPNGLASGEVLEVTDHNLHTYKPNTTITNDCDVDMKVVYSADTKAYIDNKFTELQNAILASGANV